jgi:hypothetical protein
VWGKPEESLRLYRQLTRAFRPNQAKPQLLSLSLHTVDRTDGPTAGKERAESVRLVQAIRDLAGKAKLAREQQKGRRVQ